MNHYFAYGLGIHSALLLPELVEVAGANAEVSIRIDAVQHPAPDRCPRWGCSHFADNEASFFWEGIGSFLVRDGAEIIVEPSVSDDRCIRLPLLGTILAVLLHQRGLLVLHGSAVAIGDEVVVFLGAKGRGKSTTAAMLHGRGHQLMADDIVAIHFNSTGEPLVMPGFPQLKLWPEAAACLLGKEWESLPFLVQGYDKRSRRISRDFSSNPLPLGCICTLEEGPSVDFRRLNAQKSLIQLIAHNYVARFGRKLLHGCDASSHLERSARLASRVPFFRLERPASLSVLAPTAQLIEEHFALRRKAAAV